MLNTSSNLGEDGGRVTHSRGLRTWGGTLSLSAAESAFDLADGVLRLPDGGEGRLIVCGYRVVKDGDEMEVQGSGPAPFPC
ncbi:hypothetical protein [Streptomyces sp. NPDC048272]|uniref:hypothetical protein n=1 Tax=Streptomyces sp. NPDC048272 TaxID=3154616 RepID=UPI0034135F2E